MDLSKLASQPQLMSITLDDSDTIERYGESIVFYIYDRQDVPTFARMAVLDPSNFAAAADLVGQLILDSAGKPILTSGQTLPADVMMKAIAKVIETLGKLVTPTSKKTTEELKS